MPTCVDLVDLLGNRQADEAASGGPPQLRPEHWPWVRLPALEWMFLGMSCAARRSADRSGRREQLALEVSPAPCVPLERHVPSGIIGQTMCRCGGKSEILLDFNSAMFCC
eukprot:2252024-Amphidinium_carterae.1